jgi:hypothetical protein
MKKLIVLIAIAKLLTACGPKATYASNYNIVSSVITMDDGTEVTGNIDYPINAREKKVKIKDSENKKTKIDKKLINKIVCNTSAGEIEYINMKVYGGWSGTKIQKKRVILLASMKGEVTLYHCNSSGWMSTGGNSRIWVSEDFYYCKRENEPAATLIHINMNMKGLGKNVIFRKAGMKYFADNAEIANKIDKKEYTYENLYEVVALYNSKFKN